MIYLEIQRLVGGIYTKRKNLQICRLRTSTIIDYWRRLIDYKNNRKLQL